MLRQFLGLTASLVLAVPAASAVAQESYSRYDVGYAYAASKACPNLALVIEIPEVVSQDDEFKRAGVLFADTVKMRSLDWSCKAALRLYDSVNGSVLKILVQKSDPTG